MDISIIRRCTTFFHREKRTFSGSLRKFTDFLIAIWWVKTLPGWYPGGPRAGYWIILPPNMVLSNVLAHPHVWINPISQGHLHLLLQLWGHLWGIYVGTWIRLFSERFRCLRDGSHMFPCSTEIKNSLMCFLDGLTRWVSWGLCRALPSWSICHYEIP